MRRSNRRFPWISGLGVGVAVGASAWLALNLAGIANQLASVGRYFPGQPAVSEALADRVVVPEATRDGMEAESESAATIGRAPLPRDTLPPTESGDSGQADYVMALENSPASVRPSLPANSRLVMDPMMFIFDANDSDLQMAIDELVMHPDDAVRQAVSSIQLPVAQP